MSLAPRNLVILLSDEHNSAAMGCAGHAEVLTPNLDALAARGTRFTAAYTASPICVPARTALANGRYVHEAGYWDNVDAWDGKTRSWHHVLHDHGHTVVSIGKLHYRGWAGDDYGFTESQIPMHIHEGRGEVRMLLRNPPPDLGDGSGFLGKAGPGESDYTRYDRDITARALKWIADQAAKPSAKPWVLMVSIVAPHFPLIAPQEFHDIYAGRPLAMPKAYRYGTDQPHPFLQLYSEISGYNRHFRNEDDVRRALAAYYGLTSFMDDNMGRVLDSIGDAGLADSTRVLYLSDHGEHAGTRGLWGKGTMYEESAGVPMILVGADIPSGTTVAAPVSHIDVYDTVLDCVGLSREYSAASPHARSLFDTLRESLPGSNAPDANRAVISEYHTVGTRSAVFMLRDARYKYVHCVGLDAQLFDLDADPQELLDLAGRPESKAILYRCRARLGEFLDPEETDRRAKARQKELIDFYGGEEAIRKTRGTPGYTPPPKA